MILAGNYKMADLQHKMSTYPMRALSCIDSATLLSTWRFDNPYLYRVWACAIEMAYDY